MQTLTSKIVQARLRELADPVLAEGAQRYFKTGKGEYGEGDRFLGLRAAQIHATVKEHRDLSIPEVVKLLQSPFNEDRLTAVLIWVTQMPKAPASVQKEIYELYLANTHRINSWGLVDCSAPGVVGYYLLDKNRKPVHRLAQSEILWERRIAVLATFTWIRKKDCADTLKICEVLLKDQEDLIHKATGWMLREVGKRDLASLEGFLDAHARIMPRTMLRYAIERMSPERRGYYLKLKGS
jgi:3-methyladenine DNA glycosylase AlkD